MVHVYGHNFSFKSTRTRWTSSKKARSHWMYGNIFAFSRLGHLRISADRRRRRRIPEDTLASLRRREGDLRGWAELRRRAAATARSEPGVVAQGLSGGLRVVLAWRLRRFFVVGGGDEPAQIMGWVSPPPDRRAGLVWIVFFRSFLGELRWFLQQRTVLFWTLYGEFLLESVLVLSGVDADMKGNFAELMIKF